MQFKYNTYHIPTNTFLEAVGDFTSQEDFLRHLNKWNREGCGRYIYTSVDYIQPKGDHTVVNQSILVLLPKSHDRLHDELEGCVGEGC